MNDWDKLAAKALDRFFHLEAPPEVPPLLYLLQVVLECEPRNEASPQEQEAFLNLTYKAPETVDRIARAHLASYLDPIPDTLPELRRWAGGVVLAVLTVPAQSSPSESPAPQE